MTVDRIVHIFAGAVVLLSLALAHFHSHNWLWLTAFVGANLFQSGLTNWCLLSSILRKFGVPDQAASCCAPGGEVKAMAIRIALGLVIGGALGYAYQRLVGCSTGTCPLTATPLRTIVYGAVMGLLWATVR